MAVERIDRPAVAIFGSARVHEGSPPYEQARATAHGFADAGWAVVTGGGPGVMEGANRGCREGGGLSVGFNIELPHEQGSNPYIDIGYTFKHFYARKVCFVKPAEEAESHLIVGHEDRGHARLGEEVLAHVVPRTRAPVAPEESGPTFYSFLDRVSRANISRV